MGTGSIPGSNTRKKCFFLPLVAPQEKQQNSGTIDKSHQNTGFENLFFIERSPSKLDGVLPNGVKVYPDFETLGNLTFKYIYDTTGIPNILTNCFDFLDIDGQLVLVGQPRLNSELKLKNPLRFFNGIKIFASDGGGFDPDLDLINVKHIIETNTQKFNALISHKISLDEVNDGFDLMRSGLARRVIMEF